MPNKNDHSVIPSQGGVFGDLALRVKLILRLMKDGRVSPLLKILPIGSLLYFLIPDLLIGPVDDMAVIWLGGFLFVELCPPEVVREHAQALAHIIPEGWYESIESDDNVIEGEFRED
jgi:hypothetical protein